MAVRLGVIRAERQSAQAMAAHSRTALDRPLRCAAELWVAEATTAACLVGAFQRAAGIPDVEVLLRRGSGGPEVLVGEGTLHVALALAHPAVFIACDEKHIVNRYVRPLLRAITQSMPGGALAHFFGRDWIAVAHRPAAWAGFAHDATTRRTVFEAFVAVRSPFARGERRSFRGRRATTLEDIAGGAVEPARLAAAIVAAYAASALDLECIAVELPSAEPALDAPGDGDLRSDPPWTATVEEAIGTLGAGWDASGTFRVGGDLLASRDALARLEARAAVTANDDLGRIVDESFSVPGVALDGVRSLESLRDVIARAIRSPPMNGELDRSADRRGC